MKLTGNEPANPASMKVEMLTDQSIESMDGRIRWEKLPELVDVVHPGLTIRQQFAKDFMMAYITSTNTRCETFVSKLNRLCGFKNWHVTHDFNCRSVAKASIEAADFLIAELNKEP